MDKRIAIIGCGNIGFRHLQGVLTYISDETVYCIDKSKAALEKCLEEADQRGKKVIAGEDISCLPKQIDLAIIATTSAIRRNVFEELITHIKVDNIIFEKVLFQKIEDYFFVQEKIKELNIKAYVNCARRGSKSYKELKEIIKEELSYEIHITGGQWRFCSNAIHQLDMIAFLTDTYEELNLRDLCLDDRIMEAKRSGFKEVNGTVIGKCGKCTYFTISCFDEQKPLEVEIIGKKRYLLKGSAGRLMIIHEDNTIEEREFRDELVSYLTGVLVQQILEEGRCDLPDYTESMTIHLKFVQPLIEFFEGKGLDKGICPIT